MLNFYSLTGDCLIKESKLERNDKPNYLIKYLFVLICLAVLLSYLEIT